MNGSYYSKRSIVNSWRFQKTLLTAGWHHSPWFRLLRKLLLHRRDNTATWCWRKFTCDAVTDDERTPISCKLCENRWDKRNRVAAMIVLQHPEGKTTFLRFCMCGSMTVRLSNKNKNLRNCDTLPTVKPHELEMTISLVIFNDAQLAVLAPHFHKLQTAKRIIHNGKRLHRKKIQLHWSALIWWKIKTVFFENCKKYCIFQSNVNCCWL